MFYCTVKQLLIHIGSHSSEMLRFNSLTLVNGNLLSIYSSCVKIRPIHLISCLLTLRVYLLQYRVSSLTSSKLLLMTSTVEICIQQLGRVKVMV